MTRSSDRGRLTQENRNITRDEKTSAGVVQKSRRKRTDARKTMPSQGRESKDTQEGKQRARGRTTLARTLGKEVEDKKRAEGPMHNTASENPRKTKKAQRQTQTGNPRKRNRTDPQKEKDPPGEREPRPEDENGKQNASKTEKAKGVCRTRKRGAQKTQKATDSPQREDPVAEGTGDSAEAEETKRKRDRFSVALYATEERSPEGEKLCAGQNRGVKTKNK